jgi:hypothetical protein
VLCGHGGARPSLVGRTVKELQSAPPGSAPYAARRSAPPGSAPCAARRSYAGPRS